MSAIMNNAEQRWDNFNTSSYNRQYTDEILVDDRCLSAATIIGLYALHLSTGIEFGSMENGADYGNGGAALSAAYGAPFIQNKPGALAWVDRGKPQLLEAEKNIAAGKRRQLQEWESQQQYLGDIRPEWRNSLYYAADIGVAREGDGFNPEPNSVAVGQCSFFHESGTSNPAEWKDGTVKFFRSVTPGGLVINRYMIGSTGYTSAGEEFLSTEIYPEDMLRLAEPELTHIQSYTYFKPPESSHGARPEGDKHDYKGMGVLIGQRRIKTTYIV